MAVDRRKLKKVGLHHLSWDQVRAQAVLVARHQGVADPTQGKVLDEFIRYMSHARSGLGGLVDMGPSWVTVRDAVKAKTARPSDKAVGEVSARFDELVQHLGYHLSGLLGVEVQALPPRAAPDHASRRQQLADSGLLFGRLRIPGAVDVVVVGADLRADKATASITAAAPRGETRPLTRISWLLRQLPDEGSDAIRIEAHVADRVRRRPPPCWARRAKTRPASFRRASARSSRSPSRSTCPWAPNARPAPGPSSDRSRASPRRFTPTSSSTSGLGSRR